MSLVRAVNQFGPDIQNKPRILTKKKKTPMKSQYKGKFLLSDDSVMEI